MKYFAIYTIHHMDSEKIIYKKSHMAFNPDDDEISVEIKTPNPYIGFNNLPEYIDR